MTGRAHLLFPAPEKAWELWAGGARPQTLPDAKAINGTQVNLALPVDRCRSFPLLLPSKDRRLFRDMIFAQLEKRRLVRSGSVALFDFESLGKTAGGTLVRVDLPESGLPDELSMRSAVSLAPALRYFHLPEHKLVLTLEHGRLVLAANRGGRLLYSVILDQKGELREETAREIQLALMSLDSNDFLEKIDGLELWGEFTQTQARALGEQLGMKVSVVPRPPPDSALKPRKGALIPVAAPSGSQKRQRFLVYLTIAVALLMGYLVVIKKLRDRLNHLRAQVSAMHEGPGSSTGPNAFEESNKRWQALINVIETRRYPLIQLNQIAKIMPQGGMILKSFETKISEAKIRGTANSAKAVFDLVKNLNSDPDLGGVFSWSRKDPEVNRDGSVEFELTGKQK